MSFSYQQVLRKKETNAIINLVLCYIAAHLSMIFNFIFALYFLYSLSFFIIIKNIFNSVSQIKNWIKLHWIFVLISSILWIVCDLSWYFYKYILLKNYENYVFLRLPYLICVILILFASISFFMEKISSIVHSKFIIFIDIIGVLLTIGFFFYGMTLSFDFVYIFSNFEDICAILSMVFNFVTLFVILTLILASEQLNITHSSFYFIIACVIFAIISIFYSYNFLTSKEYDSQFFVLLFLLPFGIFMFGAMELNNSNAKFFKKNINLLQIIKWLPLIAMAIFVLQNKFNSKIAISLFFIIVIHTILSYYIKNSIYSKQLINREIELHQRLETTVQQKTNELNLINLKLQYALNKDSLTGLGNRSFFTSHLKQILKDLHNDQQIVTYYVDISRFKAINNSYGHEVGDNVLKNIANRILMLCKEKELISRIGVDRFIIVFLGKQVSKTESINFAKNIIKFLKEPIVIDSYTINIDCVVGISVTNHSDNANENDILRNIDKAIYYAKENPNLNPVFYGDDIDRHIKNKSDLEIYIREANLEEEFELYYQPIFDINNNKITSAEALIRWNSKEYGFLEAEKFIDIASTNEIINDIYHFSIKKILSQIYEWEKTGIKYPKMSINIAEGQSRTANFVSIIKQLMKTYKINPNSFEVELSDMIWMNSINVLDEIFQELNSFGIKVCIDDFGIGYSSLIFIKKYNIHRFKIARKLTQNLSENSVDMPVIKSIIDISKVMDIKTTIKGIENNQIIELLKKLNCDEAQGYAFAKPMKVSDFEIFLKENKDMISDF